MPNPELLISIDYGDGTPKEWKTISTTLPKNLQVIYDTAISRKLALNSIPALRDYLIHNQALIEDDIIEYYIRNGDEYVIDLCGGRTATINEINEAIESRDEAALYYFGLDNATEDEIEKFDASSLQSLPPLRYISEYYASKNPFDEGWEYTAEFYDPNAEEL